jgi:hypothetical protein
MMFLASIPFFACRHLCLAAAFGLVLTLAVFSGAAQADDNPFDLETSSWMSFDRYKDKPSNWIAPEERDEATSQPVIAPPALPPPDMPQIITPASAPLTPVMPGVNANNGFDVKVDSTEDDNRPSQSLLNDSGNEPGAAPRSKDWEDAVAIARHLAQQKIAGREEQPFHVRFSNLPVMPTLEPKAPPATAPAPVAPPAPAKKIETVQAKPPAPPAPPKVDAAVCAALDAYKKHQLAAIESDRQTLTALQKAIAQLGLQKKLDFMPGTGGTLDMQAAGSSGTNAPATLAPAAKN